MNKKVTIDNLSSEIMKTLKEFEGVTDKDCEDGVLDTAEEAVKELRQANPPGSGEYQSWKKYNSGWGIKATIRGKKTSAVVHNKKEYRLTHLLEFGHALVAGGRRVGRTRAFEHIAPVAKRAEENLVKNIRKRVENG